MEDQVEGSALANFFSNLLDGYTFDGTTATILSIMAHITLLMLFVSPMPTLLRIREKRSTESFPPYPYVGAVMYFTACLFYGIPIHPPPFAFRFHCLLISGTVGTFVFALYCSTFGTYTTAGKRAIVVCLPPVFVVVWFATYIFWLNYWMKTVGDAYVVTCMLRTYLSGPLLVFFGAIMYGSPLIMTNRVLMTRSTEYMPFWFSLACFLNGLLWVIYACLPQTYDLYIAIANGIGVVSGFLQLMVRLVFYVLPHRVKNIHPKKKKKKN